MILTAIVFFFILSILVLIHEAGHFIAAKKNGVMVEEFGFGLPPRLFGKKIGETIYSINWLPFGGFVKVLGEEQHELNSKKIPESFKNRTFYHKSNFQKLIILTAGVMANFLLGWFVISIILTYGIPTPTNDIIIDDIVKDSPAQEAGIKKGDLVKQIRVNGQVITLKNVDHFIEVVKKHKGQEIEVSLTRQSRLFTVSITPRLKPPPNQGALGVSLSQFVIKKYKWYEAPFYSLIESSKITVIIVRELLKTLFTLALFQKPDVDVAGPLGIAKLTGQAVKVGWLAVLQLLGILSLNLAVINIMPFPALDGGRVAFVIYEAISGRKVRQQVEQKLNLIGFAILITLIIVVTINDIVKFFVK